MIFLAVTEAFSTKKMKLVVKIKRTERNIEIRLKKYKNINK